MPFIRSTLSDILCQFCEELHFEDMPPEVIEKTKLLILDLVGIILATQAEPFDAPLRALRRTMDGDGIDVNTGHYCVVGGNKKIALPECGFSERLLRPHSRF